MNVCNPAENDRPVVDSPRIIALDGFRGLAILLVLFNHFLSGWNFSSPVFYIGASGVDLFFIISGFVIPYTIKTKKNLFEFLKKRFLRLYPVFLCCFLITLLFYTFHPMPPYVFSHRDLWLNATMIPEVLLARPLDNSYWTLAIEWEFYLLFGLIYYTTGEKGWEWISLLLLLFAMALNLYIDQWLLHSRWPADVLHYFRYIRYHGHFVTGYLFYKLWTGKRKKIYYAGILVCFVHQCVLYPRLYDNAGLIDNGLLYRIFLGMYVIIFLIFIHHSANGLCVCLGKFFRFTGTISYPLYLLHQYIGRHFLLPVAVGILQWNYYLGFVLALSGVYGLSYLVHIWVERRFLGVK